ncbi:MAG: YqzL family protein [Oscillospiraceae bacterium]|jgi:hypothetical protein|nr:YqzL family protein [Oscillospiraceae bacterium]
MSDIDIAWKLFADTGNIDAYFIYKSLIASEFAEENSFGKITDGSENSDRD